MIADTTFLSDFRKERERNLLGPARTFAVRHRARQVLITVISAGEIAAIFDATQDARSFLRPYRILRLTPEIAYVAAEIERELPQRLGENDNWTPGFCRYYGQSVISRDVAFDRVRGLRRMAC